MYVVKNIKLINDILHYNSSQNDAFQPVIQKIEESDAGAYTVANGDVGKYVRMTSNDSADVTITVPSTTCAIGSCVTFEQAGTATLTLSADSGVTLNAYESGVSTYGQYAVIQIIKVDVDTWNVLGGTS